MEDLLGAQANSSADRIAVEAQDGESRTFGSLDSMADTVARSLRDAGVQGHEVVVSRLPRSPEAVAALHGIPRAGAVVAPASSSWSADELGRLLSVVRPRALLDVGGATVPGAALPGVAVPGARFTRKIELDTRPGSQSANLSLTVFERASLEEPERRRSLRDTHTLIWTSGSSGIPRAVRLSLNNHRASARAVIQRLDLGPDDRWLASLSFAHVGGVALVLRAAVAGSRVLTIGESFDPDAVNRLIDDGRVTHVPIVPSMLHQLLEARADRPPPGSLRCVLVGGAACPPALVERALAARFPVALTYGLTEASSQVATAPVSLVRRKPGCVGCPLEALDVRTSAGREVLVRGPTIMQGYLVADGTGAAPGADSGAAPGADTGADPGADPDVGREPPGSEVGEWLRTGDLGHIDEDGDLWITGRLGSRLVTGGVSVDPQHVESCLMGHPGVREAVVVGVPDEVWGERVVAVVVREQGGALDEATLDRFARDGLSGARRPRDWVFAGHLPRTATGKPDRKAVERLAFAELARRTGGKVGEPVGRSDEEG